MSETVSYSLPTGQLGLTGPIAWPRPGTLPIRGDMAHIALADRFLVPHYVVPSHVHIAHGPALLLLTAHADADVVTTLETGAAFEALDITASWVWGCCGAEGPTGYVARSAFDF